MKNHLLTACAAIGLFLSSCASTSPSAIAWSQDVNAAANNVSETVDNAPAILARINDDLNSLGNNVNALADSTYRVITP